MINKPKRGRPRKQETMVFIPGFYISQEMADKIESKVQNSGLNKADVLRQILENGLIN